MLQIALLLAVLSPLAPVAAQAQLGEQASLDGAYESTVLGQLEALRLGDFDTAFGFASEAAQRHFRTPEAFAMMVLAGYDMIVDPKEITFLDTRPDGRMIWQKILIQTHRGEAYVLDYQLVPGREGWKINAVRSAREDGTPA
jgi:hypothetical protein